MQSNTPKTSCNITLDVTLDSELPPGDHLYITGNLPELGNWDPSGVRLKPVRARRYQINLKVPEKSIIECKLTRGTWKTQGIISMEDVPPSNLVIKVVDDETVPVRIIDWLDQQVTESDPVVGRLLTFNNLVAPGLRYQRPIQVWLPDNVKPEAVIYMHDGQNLFEPAAAFSGVDWKVDETITGLIERRKIRNCMVVGIPNSPDRMQELNLFTDAGQAYADFIVDVVKPFIDSTFSARTDPENTFIMGSSMGGLMSFQMAYFMPSIFGGAGCLSSAFGKTDGAVYEMVKSTSFVPDQLRIYLDTGEYEPPIVKAYFKMMNLLKTRGFIEGYNLKGYFSEKAIHCESAWAKRLAIPLEFLLKY
ncbi:MAG: alpha/beta hydrolase-fold protein [Candidatus Rifleibacteriota bacterium]